MRILKVGSGFGLLAIGIVMLVLPGPGWLTIALALAILATEFEWARRLQDRVKRRADRLGKTLIDLARRRKRT